MNKILSKEHLKLVLRSLKEFQQLKPLVEKAIQENPEILDEIISKPFYWSELYEKSFLEHLGLAMKVMGIDETIAKAMSEKDDPYEYILTELIEEVPNEWEAPTISGAELKQQDLFAVVFSLSKTIDAFSTYGKTLNMLVQEVANGFDESLYEAVRIDHSIVSNPTIATRISRAEIEDDEAFFRKLSNAVSSREKKTKKELDDFRFMMVILEEEGMLDGLSQEEAYQLMCIDLKVYPVDGEDPAGSLSKQINRFKKARRTPN